MQLVAVMNSTSSYCCVADDMCINNDSINATATMYHCGLQNLQLQKIKMQGQD